jgi:hypothetical protein
MGHLVLSLIPLAQYSDGVIEVKPRAVSLLMLEATTHGKLNV